MISLIVLIFKIIFIPIKWLFIGLWKLLKFLFKLIFIYPVKGVIKLVRFINGTEQPKHKKAKGRGRR